MSAQKYTFSLTSEKYLEKIIVLRKKNAKIAINVLFLRRKIWQNNNCSVSLTPNLLIRMVMKELFNHIMKYACVVVLLTLPVLIPRTVAEEQRQPVRLQKRIPVDSVRPLARNFEMPQLPSRMMSSPLPVEIRQQGRQLCIKSRYAQLLPIYTASGTYYSSMRLIKGTNWLTGLPRGAYMINNQRYTIN